MEPRKMNVWNYGNKEKKKRIVIWINLNKSCLAIKKDCEEIFEKEKTIYKCRITQYSYCEEIPGKKLRPMTWYKALKKRQELLQDAEKVYLCRYMNNDWEPLIEKCIKEKNIDRYTYAELLPDGSIINERKFEVEVEE